MCHCEEATGRRGALSAQREEVPLGCNLAVPGRIVGKPTGNATRAEFATILMRYAKL